MVLAVQAQAGTAWNPDGQGWFRVSDERAWLPALMDPPYRIFKTQDWDVRSEFEFAVVWDPRYSVRGSWRSIGVARSIVGGSNVSYDGPISWDRALAVGLDFHRSMLLGLADDTGGSFNPDGLVLGPRAGIEYLQRQSGYMETSSTSVNRNDSALRARVTLPLARWMTLWGSYEGSLDEAPSEHSGIFGHRHFTFSSESWVGLRFYGLAPAEGRAWIPRLGPAGSWRFDLAWTQRNSFGGLLISTGAELGITRGWSNGISLGVAYRASIPANYDWSLVSQALPSHGAKLSLGWALPGAKGPPLKVD